MAKSKKNQTLRLSYLIVQGIQSIFVRLPINRANFWSTLVDSFAFMRSGTFLLRSMRVFPNVRGL
jgi:hypothetical protein